MNDDLIIEILGLSSGTIASLTGLRKYQDVDKIVLEFIEHTKKSGVKYENWVDAWRGFYSQ